MEPWKKTLYISWFVLFLHAAAMAMISPFLPLYVRELGITDTAALAVWSGIIIGITPLFSGLMAPFWGTISDKYGRRALILRSTFGISLFVLFMSFVTNVYQLTVLRMLHGICGGIAPAFTALIAFQLPREKTGEGMGIMQSAIFTGSIIGPFMGGIIADWLGFRNVLLVIFLLTAVAGVITLFFIHEPKRSLERPRSTIRSNVKLVLSSPSLRVVALTIFIIQFSLFIVQPILPLYIVSLAGHNSSATMVGLVFAVTGFTTLIFAPLWGRAGDRSGHKAILEKSLLYGGIAFFPQALVTSSLQLLVLRAFFGFFIAGIIPATQSLIVKNTKDSQRGGVLGITHSVYSGGHALGPLMGGIMGGVLGYRYTIVIASALLIVQGYFFRRVFQKTPITLTV